MPRGHVGLAWWWRCLAALLSLTLLAPVLAQDLQPVPALTARVTDAAGALTARQKEALEAKLASFERDSGTQMVVLIVGSTQPEDIAAYAYRVADAWKVGRRDVGDGLLILVAKDDRRVRIEVAKALEGAVPDLAAKIIIDNAIRPAFKAGDYAGGLNSAVDQLAARVRGEALPAPTTHRPKSSGGFGGQGWDQLALFFFLGVPIVGAVLTGLLGRKLGGLATGGAAGAVAWLSGAPLALAGVAGFVAIVLVGVLGIGSAARRAGGLRGGHGAPVIWGGGGGGGGGGGNGGGGFSSGGGGDFGGGGASGGW